MDHCYAGDLYDFIDHYEEIGKPIPEPFIWWTMECLASALVQMETCARARSHAREQKDETIVMVDMKPKNIFLDAAGYSKRYHIYPRPKVGDFGSAHLTHKQDPANVFCKLEVLWSRGFLAPELSRPYHSGDEKEAIDGGDDENEDEDEDMDDAEPIEDDVETHVEEQEEHLPLYSWTIVWQLGRTIECMMRLRYPRDRNWDNNMIDLNSQIKVDPPRHGAQPNFPYSEDLIDIVWQCGQHDDESRPTPSDLLDMIKSTSPQHVHRMDFWGTEAWVAEQYEDMDTLTEDRKKFMKASIKERAGAGKLWFLNDFENQNLAAQYRELDLDPAQGCELTWKPNVFRNRIGQILGAEDSEPEPESPGRMNNKRPRTDEAITMTHCHKKPRI
jgi:serine/threonine protein kinase